MSNSLAVASVSFVLVDLLNNGLIDRDISAALGDVSVSAVPPDKIDVLQTNGHSQLNLFLYNVTQNQGWRNAAYPSRDANGERLSNPPLALDLHYLLTAYGAEPFHAEILLGYGMQLFHETPVLPRAAIRKSLSAPSQVIEGSSGLPVALLNLFTSGLADQVEQVKIWPQTLTTEEISRLWTAFQAKYRPTAAYQASVVLIESQASTKSALPVQRRTVTAIPFNKPVISQILSIGHTSPPLEMDQAMLPGYQLVLIGSQLKGTGPTSVLIGSEEVFPDDADVAPSKIIVSIPSDITAGNQSVQVVQHTVLGSPPVAHRTVESDPATFVLHPVILNIQTSTGVSTITGLPVTQLDITLEPPVAATQNVVLLLNQLPPAGSPPETPLSYTFVAPPPFSLASPPIVPSPPSPIVSIPYFGVTPGSYLVRVQVDGAESLLTQDSTGLFTGPKVVL
jgi:hypothetical protein